MLTLGKYYTLRVTREIKHGFILEAKQGQEILLPGKLADKEYLEGDMVRVFLYKDSDGRYTATRQDPKVTLNHIALLEAKDVNRYGAYLDWGLDKDLFVPHSEQMEKMQPGQSYLIYMYLDKETNRLVATTKIQRFLDNTNISVKEQEKVDLWIWNRTDLGYNVIINEQHEGLIYHNEFFTDIQYGDKTTGYIKQIRPDDKIDVTLRPIGYDKIAPSADRILQHLKESGGFLDLHDKSDPEEIRDRLQMSKKTFKRSIGLLYKKDLIRIENNGITYINESSK